MPSYRRARIPGGTFFFTVVTHGRRPILTTDEGLSCLRESWRATRQRFPFRSLAVCVLPDHLHCIWTLPEDDRDFSIRWRSIKGRFSRFYAAGLGSRIARTRSRRSRREAGVWQRRFWEHWIRDEEDLRQHVDYIHYNPVKHGLVRRPAGWPWSTFHRYVERGWYEPEWGTDGMEGLEDLETARE